MSTLPSFLPPRVAYYEIAHLTDGPLTATKLNLWSLAQPLLPFTLIVCLCAPIDREF